jgi:hypothetical protein
MSNKRTIEIKERMYLLKNMNEENDFKICKLKSWGSYRMISLREIKTSNYRFNPSSKYKHLLGNKWGIVFRGELDIGYIDIEKMIDKFIENSHKTNTKIVQNRKNKKKGRSYEKCESETQKEYIERMSNQIEQTTEYETD